jgi:formamidase
MSGLGGLNKSPDGVVIGLVQLQNPSVVTKEDLAKQTDRICQLVGKAQRNLSTMDLVVFPEYALHGLSMDTNPAIMCTLDGPEVGRFKQACVDNRIWGCFSIMELNPGGNPFNSGIIIDDRGTLRLYYRKMHPWVPVEPWEPGDIGIPICDGPNGSKIALIICHDGMFPEMARESAYKGANIMLRTAGYTAPIRHAWHVTNQANAFCNLMYTANVCLAGSDGSFNSMGEGMIVNYDGVPLVTGNGIPDEIITAEVRPRLCDEARIAGASRTTSISSAIAAMSPCKGAHRIAPIPSCRISPPDAIGFRGKRRSASSTVRPAAFRPRRTPTAQRRTGRLCFARSGDLHSQILFAQDD